MIIETFDNTTQEVLKELEKTQKQFWNISRTTAEFLYNIIVDSKAKSVVELKEGMLQQFWNICQKISK